MPLPTSFAAAEREKMVRDVMEMIQVFRDDMFPTDPRWIVGMLRDLLRAGVTDREHTIASARAGDVLSHEALMLEFRELTDNHILPPASLCDYVGKPDLHPRGRTGAAWWVNFRRDFRIAFLVYLTCEAYGIAATRNPASSRKIHCAAAVVAEALNKSCHGPITEQTVANVCGRSPAWDRLWSRFGWSLLDHTKFMVMATVTAFKKPR
jgi:hypothetical protein